MKYLGVDFGLRRIGLARSEGTLASPWQVISVKGFSDAFKKTVELVRKEEIDKVVIGLPEGKIGQTVLGFVKALRENGLDVETADETLSSRKALEDMIAQSIPREQRKSTDALAAAIILQNWLDSR